MSLPDFICIGAQKAGTTWLYEMLAQNPSIWLPPLKELHFLSYASKPRGNKREDAEDWGPKKIRVHLNRKIKEYRSAGSGDSVYADYLQSLAAPDILSEGWYRRVFSFPAAGGKLKGEITPAYLAMNENGVRYAHKLLGDRKFILVVREPASRALSNLKNSAQRRIKQASPQTLLHRLIRRFMDYRTSKLKDDFWHQVVKQIKNNKRGDYRQSIPRWQKYFGEEKLLILPFGDIRSTPNAFLAKIEAFIGAASFGGYKSLETQVHKTRKIEIPPWVTSDIEQLMQPQQEFLRSRFGDAFYQRTK